MKSKNLLFLIALLVIQKGISQQTKPAKKPIVKTATTSPAKVVQGQLLMKSNVPASVLINEKISGTLETGVLKTLNLNPGKSIVSVVPADEQKYLQFDTIVTVNAGVQDVLIVNLREKVVTAVDVMDKVLASTGFSGFGKQFNALQYDVTEAYQVKRNLFVFPDNGYLISNYKQKEGVDKSLYSETVLYNNYEYKKNNYFFYLDGTKEKVLTGGGGPNEAWDMAENKNTVSFMLQDIFLGNLNGFHPFDIHNSENIYQNLDAETIGGKTILKVMVTREHAWSNSYGGQGKQFFTAIFYIDKDTYLPVKVLYVQKTDKNEEQQVEFSYSNFKLIAPLMIPEKKSIILVKNNLYYSEAPATGETIISNVQINPVVTDPEKKFYRPQNVK